MILFFLCDIITKSQRYIHLYMEPHMNAIIPYTINALYI